MSVFKLTNMVSFLLIVICSAGYAVDYYVNDDSTNNDVYCSVIGALTNDGLSALQPKSSLQAIIDTYALSGGDVVYTDTGLYVTQSVLFTSSDQGAPGNPLFVVGSTNLVSGGSQFSQSGFRLNSCAYITIQNITISNVSNGIYLDDAQNILVENMFIKSCNPSGFRAEGNCADSYFNNCLAVGNLYAYWADNGLIGGYWKNGTMFNNTYAVMGYYNTAIISNSIVSGGSLTYLTHFGPRGDNNIFWNVNLRDKRGLFPNLDYYQRITGCQYQSIIEDPLFASESTGDFHVQSVVGFYSNGYWRTSATHSVAIDFASSSDPSYTNEPTPNGLRVNSGLFGGTRQASMSRTSEWLKAVSYNDGGMLLNTGILYWTFGSFTNNATVKLEYSWDGGVSWSNIVTGLPVTNQMYILNATNYPVSLYAYWRIVSEGSPSVLSSNENFFSLRRSGSTFNLYVNDEDATGDIYCTAVGSETNSGLTSDSPLSDLQMLLDRYDLGAGDTIWVDTGLYTNPVTISVFDQGDASNFLYIVGSTNIAPLKSTFLINDASRSVLTLSGASFVSVRDLVVGEGLYGIYITTDTLNNPQSNMFSDVYCISNVAAVALNSGAANQFKYCVAAWNDYGIRRVGGGQSVNVGNLWDSGIMYSNQYAIDVPWTDTLSISNSILVGGNYYNGTIFDCGDYNTFWHILFGGYANLTEFQKDRDRYWNSFYIDPLFVDPNGLDFHLKSVTGSYSNGVWNLYEEHSPCIDMGSLFAIYTNEPNPNGSNLNIGVYGNTREASKSRTNGWLFTRNYNDGGLLNAGVDTIYWNFGNIETNETVMIELSRDSGQSWITIATNVSVSDKSYLWAGTNQNSSLYARWRIILESDTNVSDSVTGDFIFKNGPFLYFVNDDSTSDDVYTTVPGNSTNLGVSASTPKASLQEIIDTYDVQPGDTIYIDTGNYDLTVNLSITALDSGTNGNPVLIQGSTNQFAAKSVISRNSLAPSSYAMHLNPVNGAVHDLVLRNLTLKLAGYGLYADNAYRIQLDNVMVQSCRFSGLNLISCSNSLMQRNLVVNNGDGIRVTSSKAVSFEHGVIWGNTNIGIKVNSGWVTISNSIICSDIYCYDVPEYTNIMGDYNVLYANDYGSIGTIGSYAGNLDTLSAWVGITSQEIHSLSTDPLFADPVQGDFHLMTVTPNGRRNNEGALTSDSYTSPLIDSGAPFVTFTNEPIPNGGRLNIGLYGNTWQASVGRANSWLLTASLQYGGWVQGMTPLHWVAGGLATGHTVKIEFSHDGGGAWSILTNGINASDELYIWNTTETNDTPAGLWRVVSLVDSNIFYETTNFFSVRNAPLNIYVNDDSTDGDVYTMNIGAGTNWAATPMTPLDSLARAFTVYDLEAQDTIWVDNGNYVNEPLIEISKYDSGTSNAYVSIVGNTNAPYSGTFISPDIYEQKEAVCQIDNASCIAISNLTLSGGTSTLLLTNTSDIALSMRVINSVSNGVKILQSDRITFKRAVIENNGHYGINLFNATNVVIDHSVLWSNSLACIYISGGNASVKQSVLKAEGVGNRIFYAPTLSFNINSDYNDVLVKAQAGIAQMGSSEYKYLSDWRELSSNDIHSLSQDPLFFDPGNGDFHVLSEMGRYQDGVIVTDSVSSLLMDTGDPVALYTNELDPNGGRVNIGLYGNHIQASLSRTNGWLLTLSLNDGGIIRGSNWIYWAMGGPISNDLVFVDFSDDGGVTWTNIATNILASEESVFWNTTNYNSTALGVWRVVLGSDTNIYSSTENFFAVKNEPLGYYVNDASMDGDIYCTAPGLSINNGLRPSTPKNSIQDVLESYVLEAGDQVFVDTGSYEIYSNVMINSWSGDTNNPIWICGSTNYSKGGSFFNANKVESAFFISEVSYVGVKHLVISNAGVGIHLQQANNCIIEDVAVIQGGDAFCVEGSQSNLFSHCAAYGFTSNGLHTITYKLDKQSSDTHWQQGILASLGYVDTNSTAMTTGTCVYSDSGDVSVSGSVCVALGSQDLFFLIGLDASVCGDYNNFYTPYDVMIAKQSYLMNDREFKNYYDSVACWSLGTGSDVQSLSHDPGFFNMIGGDYHLLSQSGRYNVVTSNFEQDSSTSVLLDAGDPVSVYTNEPMNNGSRVNIGRYGNTQYASMTPTNGALTIISLNDGGSVSGSDWPLYWVASGDATGYTVRILYSSDGGIAWNIVASNIPASYQVYDWNTTLFTDSVRGVWAIESENNSNVFAESDHLFAVRNNPINFYVNDTNLLGDVYTSAIGAQTNTGLSPDSPKLSISDILDVYDLEANDVLWVDTGVYTASSDCVIGQLDTGDGINRVIIQGSTNDAAGGTILQGYGIEINDSKGLALHNLIIKSCIDSGVEVSYSTNTYLEWIYVVEGDHGFNIQNSYQTFLNHCVAMGVRSNGLMHTESYHTDWRNGVLWSNRVGVQASISATSGGGLSVSNSVIGVLSSGAYGFSIACPFSSDYNCMYIADNAYAATESDQPIWQVYKSLSRWARDTERDVHSLSENPEFADAGSLDFHLKSQQGRYDAIVEMWTNDLISSSLLDAGDKLDVYTNEPVPNGSRINIGLYGNTAQASMTITNGSFTTITLNDGGRAEGTNWPLRWIAHGVATGHLVRIEFSPDNGASWELVATNLLAADELYVWDTTEYTNTIRGLWAIISENNPSIYAQTLLPFALRNAPINFYVNDNSLLGDVYTAAIGAPGNLGLSPLSPNDSIKTIFDVYDLEPGDILYVDTGVYSNPASIEIGQLDSAASTNASVDYVYVIGSSNHISGGSVLNRAGGSYGIQLNKALKMNLKNLNIENASVAGINATMVDHLVAKWLTVTDSGKGIDIEKTDDLLFEHCVVANCNSDGLTLQTCNRAYWDHGILWSNKSVAINLSGADFAISNSIIGVLGEAYYAYRIAGVLPKSDYNCIYLQNNAYAASIYENKKMVTYQNVSLWQRRTDKDLHSLTEDPLFINTALDDFHLCSQEGRFDGTNFVIDVVSSPLIDAGDPYASYSEEEEPNGSRLNIGLYGGTTQASKTATNASFSIISLNDGGRTEGLADLYWISHGSATSHTVMLEYSSDGGLTWHSIVSGISAEDGYSVWNTTLVPSSILFLWRVVSQTDPLVSAECSEMFAVRNEPLSFYINDESLVGDVYTTAAGNITNWGTYIYAPNISISNILGRWDIEPGDTIYIDTGIYNLNSAVVINSFDVGLATNDVSMHVTFMGSTNDYEGGSLLRFFTGSDGIILNYTPGMTFKHLRIQDANRGILAQAAENCLLEHIWCEKNRTGFELYNCIDFSCRSCLAKENYSGGLLCDGLRNEVTWQNGILWSNVSYGVKKDKGLLTVNNTIFGIFGSGSYGYFLEDRVAIITSEYNNIYIGQNGSAGAVLRPKSGGIFTNVYKSVEDWRLLGRDLNSFSTDPRFADLSVNDYHLQTDNGRYAPGIGWITNLSERPSVMIDGGDPVDEYRNEPMPNGGKINIGLYGNTGQASKTPTNGWYECISLNDGGTTWGTNQLRWFAGWIATGHVVRLDFSPDDGVTWTNIVTNYPAWNLSYLWDSTPYGRSALGRWRITSEVNTNISATNTVAFTLRNGGGIPYFVNDYSTNGDVYCTVEGSFANSGLKPSLPLDSVQAVLDKYALDYADIIYVDSGQYNLSDAITIGIGDSGSGTNRVTIQGSTNGLVPSVFSRGSYNGLIFDFQNTELVDIADVSAFHAANGVSIQGSLDCALMNVKIADMAGLGVAVIASDYIDIINCVVYDNTIGAACEESSVFMGGSILWDNETAIVFTNNPYFAMTNCILSADGNNQHIFFLDQQTLVDSIESDFNNYVIDGGALIAEKEYEVGGNDYYVYMQDWQRSVTQDLHSLSHNPYFVDDLNGEFHLKSQEGRFLADGSVTNDNVTSPMIDVGDPSSAYTNEPDPNGERINLGIYGNSLNASMSQTNPWLLAISLNAGGMIGGTTTLRWAYGNITNDATVRVELSRTMETSWDVIASNLLIDTCSFEWDMSQLSLVANAKWRIIEEANTNISDVCDEYFSIKNHPINVYINDNNTLGDVYTTAIGQSFNSGTNPASPLNDPAVAIQQLPISAGDTIWIDTGVYSITNTWGMSLNSVNLGLPSLPIHIQGSTNHLYGGTIIRQLNSAQAVMSIANTRYIIVDSIKLTGGKDGLSAQKILNCSFSNIEAFNNYGKGFLLNSCENLDFANCVSFGNTDSGVFMSGSGYDWNHGCVWSNGSDAMQIFASEVRIKNSILQANNYGNYVYYLDDGVSVDSDYNCFYTTNYSQLIYDLTVYEAYENLNTWQRYGQADIHSIFIDPLIKDPSNGGFHVQSENGRYLNGVFVYDTTTSWAIDSGDVGASYTEETPPNGSRLNIGIYGNTEQASRSLIADPELLAVTLSDGGVMTNGQFLYWRYRGMSATNKLYFEYSWDRGTNWAVIATGVSVAVNGWIWNDDTNPPSPVAFWRLSVEGQTNISDVTDSTFIKRTGPIFYYVNDTSTNGDIYCSAPGNSDNNGYSIDSPVFSIQDILDRYILDKTDVIFVDTGHYNYNSTIEYLYTDSGSATSYVTIVGSTNWIDGGTVIDWSNSVSSGFEFKHAIGVALTDLTLANVPVGILFDKESQDCLVNNVLIKNGLDFGVRIQDHCSSIKLQNCAISRYGDGVVLDQSSAFIDSCVIWSNSESSLVLDVGSYVVVSNSVLHASGNGHYCYEIETNCYIQADYNNLLVETGAVYVYYINEEINGLPQWYDKTTNDMHTLSVDPLFADTEAFDFHLQSEVGRFDPLLGGYVTDDTNTSWLLDVGELGAPYTNEPAPNGQRRNLGLYGNTTEASKSRTNEWVLAITASSGGRIGGLVSLVWAWSKDISDTNLVIIDYSYDNGVNWTNITKVPISEEQYLWSSDIKQAGVERWFSSPLARWRLKLESNTNISDVTDSYFSLRNKLFEYYVNDTSTVGDVYTTAIGSDTNLGFFPWSPKLTFKSLLKDADLEGEDSVLIDTGIYKFSSTNEFITLSVADSGKEGIPVLIRGNTNASVSVFDGRSLGGPGTIVNIVGEYCVFGDLLFLGANVASHGNNNTFRNLIVTNGSVVMAQENQSLQTSIVVNGSISIDAMTGTISRIVAKNSPLSVRGTNVTLINSVLYGTNSYLLSVGGRLNSIKNNTIVADKTAYQQVGDDSLVYFNGNIIVASGRDNYCIHWIGGDLVSDYNNLLARNGAWIGNCNGAWERLLYWQTASGNDYNSMSDEPLFVDEGNEDFHLQSASGHWSASGWNTDSDYSPCIDTGSPDADYDKEPYPNGSRLNIGAYGNTEQASKSSFGPWLLAITMNDGGVFRGTNVLRWAAGNLNATATVRIEYSADGGGSWTTNASGISSLAGEYTWDTTLVASSLDARWRVVLQLDPSVLDQCDSIFAVRNTNLFFYVNDSNTLGDVYCSGVGNPGNSGLYSNTPKDSIQEILDQYDTEGGDIIKVDTGVYSITSEIFVIWSRGGDNEYGEMVIEGSTNYMDGGSIIERNNRSQNANAFYIPASHVTLRDLSIRDTFCAVNFESNRFCGIEKSAIYSNNYAIIADGTYTMTSKHNRVWNNSAGGIVVDGTRTVVIENCSFAMNVPYAICMSNSEWNVIQNNIFYLTSTNASALYGSDIVETTEYMYIDYNIYYSQQTSAIWGAYTDLMSWRMDLKHDYRSGITNPLFADVSAGDFHLQSSQGRYINGLGWVTDSEDSWAIDKGNPLIDYSLEPDINGDRVNIGAYGGTIYASKGDTNELLETRVLNEPTHIDETFSKWPLIWSALNLTSGTTVSVQYSGDGGATWMTLSNNVNPYQEYILWQTTPYWNTYKGYWRVITSDSNLWDQSVAPFDLFYGEFEINTESLNTNKNYIIWNGAWDEYYQVQYATNNTELGELIWYNAPTGALPNQNPLMLSPHGGDLTYEDVDSTNSRFRLYRVLWNQY